MSATWNAVEFFGDDSAHHGPCCTCCVGYCPRSDYEVRATPPILSLVRDGEYVTDRYAAVLTRLINPDDIEKNAPFKHPDAARDWDIPATEPDPSTATFKPSMVQRLTTLGIDIRDGGGPRETQHLYLAGEHIGWIMPAMDGRTLPDITRLAARVAEVYDTKAGALMRDLAEENIDALMMLEDAARQLSVGIKAGDQE